VKSDLAGDGTRAYVMRAAEGRQEVVERVIVGQVNQRQLRTPAGSGCGARNGITNRL